MMCFDQGGDFGSRGGMVLSRTADRRAVIFTRRFEMQDARAENGPGLRLIVSWA